MSWKRFDPEDPKTHPPCEGYYLTTNGMNRFDPIDRQVDLSFYCFNEGKYRWDNCVDAWMEIPAPPQWTEDGELLL